MADNEITGGATGTTRPDSEGNPSPVFSFIRKRGGAAVVTEDYILEELQEALAKGQELIYEAEATAVVRRRSRLPTINQERTIKEQQVILDDRRYMLSTILRG